MIELSSWRASKNKHISKLSKFIEDHRANRTFGLKHPVYDFLFSYYSFSRGQLLRWSPGVGVTLEVDNVKNLDWSEFYKVEYNLASLDIEQFPVRRIPYLEWAINFFKLTIKRPPVFHCFGLHEWAMLYKTNNKQHPNVPLRISNSVIEKLIEDSTICCTHYDAFRFFSEDANALNKVQLERTNVIDYEQAGCIHSNMDLYKFGYKIAPFISSDLLADLFLLARKAREIDMKASPYDLSKFGFSPIPIEIKEGREEYVQEQRNLYQESLKLREELLATYERLLNIKKL